MRFALILSLLVAIIAVVFAFQNPEQVDVEFLTFQSVPVPLALVIIVSLLTGVIVGSLVSVPSRLRARGRIKTLERQIAEGSAPVVVEKQTRVVGSSAPPPVAGGAAAGGAAETERLAAETRRMADDAQHRADDIR